MGFWSVLGGIANVGSSIFNTGAQIYQNQQNIDFQKSVNAQNQSNLENAYQIAAEDMRKAGISRTMINGGASGSGIVASNQQAPQVDGSALSNALMSIGQLKKINSDIKTQEENAKTARYEAETSRMEAEHSMDMAEKNYAEGVRQFNESERRQALEHADTVALREKELNQTYEIFVKDYAEKIRQFDESLKQADLHFWSNFHQIDEHFNLEYDEKVLMNAFERKMQENRYNFDIEKTLQELTAQYRIAEDRNETMVMVTLLGTLGKFFDWIF